MIQITSKQLLTTPLMRVLQNLSQRSSFDGTTAYRIHKIGGKIVEHFNTTNAEFNKLGEFFAKKDENGQVERDERGRHITDADKTEAYAKELEDLLATTYEIKQRKLHLASLPVAFSPEEIAALEPMLDGLEVEEEAPAAAVAPALSAVPDSA